LILQENFKIKMSFVPSSKKSSHNKKKDIEKYLIEPHAVVQSLNGFKEEHSSFHSPFLSDNCLVFIGRFSLEALELKTCTYRKQTPEIKN